jgi:very-short-patch-repair endonuclease
MEIIMKTTDILIYSVIAAFLLVAVLFGNRKRTKTAPQREYVTTPVLSPPEQVLYFRLRDELADYIILCQVSMHRVIRPKKRDKSAFNAISQKAIDFVICRKDFSTVCVVELDDDSHRAKEEKDRSRDAYMTSAGIQTIRWSVRSMPAASDIAIAMRKFEKK